MCKECGKENHKDFAGIPDKIVEKLKANGYNDMQGYLVNMRKSAYGSRFVGDFNNEGGGTNMPDGMMFANGGHNLGDAMLDALRVYYSQRTVNTMMQMIDYIIHLFEPSHHTDEETYNGIMNQVLSSPEELVKFLELLKVSMFQEGLAGEFMDKLDAQEPNIVMTGDYRTVATAIGRQISDSETTVTDEMIEGLLNEVMNTEGEEE